MWSIADTFRAWMGVCLIVGASLGVNRAACLTMDSYPVMPHEPFFMPYDFLPDYVRCEDGRILSKWHFLGGRPTKGTK